MIQSRKLALVVTPYPMDIATGMSNFGLCNKYVSSLVHYVSRRSMLLSPMVNSTRDALLKRTVLDLSLSPLSEDDESALGRVRQRLIQQYGHLFVVRHGKHQMKTFPTVVKDSGEDLPGCARTSSSCRHFAVIKEQVQD